ncbi:MAG: glutathione S-transferase family protein [Alphaproteobacteria bacterium]
MMDLYTFGTSNGFRASIALEEAGAPYRAHRVDVTKDEQKQDWFRALNPIGAIPVLVDPDGPGGAAITLTQSFAIVQYVAQKFGILMPREPRAAVRMLEWFMAAASDTGPLYGIANFYVRQTPGVPAALRDKFENRLREYYADLDRHLGGHRYLAGDAYSIADIATISTVYRNKLVMPELVPPLPHLGRWYAEVLARPAVQRGFKVPG